MNIYKEAHKKGARPYQEDRVRVIINQNKKYKNMKSINFFGLYDGHGGAFVSKYLYSNLHNYFISKKVEYPLTERYIKKVCSTVQKDLIKNNNKESKETGSTCCVGIRYKSDLTVFNIGDSRCIMCTDNMAVAVTKDHKPKWPEELKRITELGGHVKFDAGDYRIKDLAVSRAFGDLSAAPYVVPLPDVFKLKIKAKDQFIVVACDGLWDVCDNQEVVNFIIERCYYPKTLKKRRTLPDIANQLANYAINKKKSMDNVSIIIIFLN